MKALYTFLLGCFCVGVTLAQSDIASVEYFFDTDPGIGNGMSVDIDPDVEVLDQNFNIPTTGLSQGTHKLFMRAVNVDGSTTMYTYKTFRIFDVPENNAADIVDAEYYFNTDPGLGNGTNINVADVASLDENFSIPTIGLPTGTHRLFLRVKNSDNSWSMYANKTFRVADVPYVNLADIIEVEYYFNTDPGLGNGTNIDVADVASLNENFSILTTGLPIGTHRLFLRVKNSNNSWSIHANKTFRIADASHVNLADIIEAEYYFNTDPGLGNGTNIDVADVASLDENFSIPTTGLPIGTHRLFLRVKNSDNSWSMYANKVFRVSDIPFTNNASITAAEFFIDVDPGFGNAIAMSVSGDDINQNLTIPTSGSLSQGDHYLHIRVLNADGQWSIYARELFEVEGTLGLNNLDGSEIKIYPNPTSDFINITLSEGSQIKQAEIYDINGKMVFESTNHLNQINMSALESGIYLLQIETETGQISKQIIKE